MVDCEKVEVAVPEAARSPERLFIKAIHRSDQTSTHFGSAAEFETGRESRTFAAFEVKLHIQKYLSTVYQGGTEPAVYAEYPGAGLET
jgi:hypothetical protein